MDSVRNGSAKIFLLFFLFLNLVSVAPVYGASWFSGIGNDGYLNDVTGLYNILRKTPGWDDISDNHFIGTDLSGPKITDSISTLASRMLPGDSLFWYYSGHGSFVSDVDNDESIPGATSLNTWDETIGHRNDMHPLTDDALAAAFQTISDKNIHIISVLDACYAGGFVGGAGDVNSVPDIVFMGSSAENQESYSYSDEPYSIFTQGLMTGLEVFNASSDPGKILTAFALFDAANSSTLARNLDQNPVFHGNPEMIISAVHTVPVPGSGCLLFFPLAVLWGLKKRMYPGYGLLPSAV